MTIPKKPVRPNGNRPTPKPAPAPRGDRPAVVSRIGAYKLSCWKNPGEHGQVYYSCVLKRVYKVGDSWAETDKLNHSDLLSISMLFADTFRGLMEAEGKKRYEGIASAAEDEGEADEADEEGGEEFIPM